MQAAEQIRTDLDSKTDNPMNLRAKRLDQFLGTTIEQDEEEVDRNMNPMKYVDSDRPKNKTSLQNPP